MHILKCIHQKIWQWRKTKKYILKAKRSTFKYITRHLSELNFSLICLASGLMLISLTSRNKCSTPIYSFKSNYFCSIFLEHCINQGGGDLFSLKGTYLGYYVLKLHCCFLCSFFDVWYCHIRCRWNPQLVVSE